MSSALEVIRQTFLKLRFINNNMPGSGLFFAILLEHPGNAPWYVEHDAHILNCPHLVAEKVQECFRAAKYMKRLLALDLKPKSAF